MEVSSILVALLPLGSLVLAQTIVVDNTTADNATVAPTVAVVDGSKIEPCVDLFQSGTVQFMDEVVANLTSLDLTKIDLFSFADSTNVANGILAKRAAARCKTYPGDALWPFLLLWKPCDVLLGCTLVQTILYASPCCDSFGNYDQEKCGFIQNNWTDGSETTWLTILSSENPTPINSVLFNGMTLLFAINFAHLLSLRLVVKNTGWAFNAKSTAFEVYQAANTYGVTTVGEGKTVMKGYILGGNFPMSTLYGMSAYQVLSMDVISANERLLTTNSTSNAVLFRTLRGDGVSSFGVFTLVVVKAYPKIAVATLTYVLSGTALSIFFNGFITYTKAEKYEYLTNQNLDGVMNKAELRALVALIECDNYYDAGYVSFPVEPWGSNAIRQAGRLSPKSEWENQTALNTNSRQSKPCRRQRDHPAWRDTVLHLVVAALWSPANTSANIKATRNKLTYTWVKSFQNPFPGAGAYMSEADYIEPNFQQPFLARHM
ncbi:FAD binding domain-containing protein [Calycina marina]|uniref:FAD binding domain-containing protein n=1 Tax=Calycina marina TaxID=1763456 RepID=A0A9P7Z8L8_9HELO|nr:FAD binding domain-containing protein [Calycina marina]